MKIGRWFFFLLLCNVQSLFAEPIDIVYTWVDGSSVEWRACKEEWQKKLLPDRVSNAKNRYKNHEELKYSLRSLYAHAPYFNHIYIITFGQKPAFLKDHPQITIVDHKDIFLDHAHLPTFNSMAIESHLHHIPGLSEKFIYLNDDVFFLSQSDPSHFFRNDEKIIVYQSPCLASAGLLEKEDTSFFAAWKNCSLLLDYTYKKEERYRCAHAPFAFTRTLFEAVEKQFPDVFALVSSHKFRTPTDCVLTNGLIQYSGYYMRKVAFEREGKTITVNIEDDMEKNSENFQEIKKGKYLFFCLGDDTTESDEQVEKQVNNLLEGLFPTPCPWEDM